MSSSKLVIFFSFILLSFFLLIWLNKPVNSYFSQDDFFHLRMIMDKEVTDIPSFFVNRLEGQTFYRPISREIYNLIMYKLYGLNSLPFHIVNLILILINLRLLFLFIRLLSQNQVAPYLTIVFYLFSSVHSIELYYLSSIQTLLMTSFALLSCIYFVKFIKTRFLNYYLGSILFFLIALFCHESALILPGIMFLIIFVVRGLSLKKKIIFLFPIFILMGLYYLSLGQSTNLPSQQVYQPVFQLKVILNSLSWYVLWSFGIPEMLVDFVRPGLVIKDEFYLWYGYYAKIVFPLLIVLITGFIFLVWKFKKVLLSKNFIFLFACFFISISPFLVFPQHKFVYYLGFPIVWFSAILGLILSELWVIGNIHKVIVGVLLLIFSIISSQTTDLNAKTHWAAKRAKSAEVLLQQFKKDYPILQKGSTFYIIDDPDYPVISEEWGTSSKQAFYILSGSDAIQLLYNDPSIKVYFEALGDLPKNLSSNNLISFTAKFPY